MRQISQRIRSLGLLSLWTGGLVVGAPLLAQVSSPVISPVPVASPPVPLVPIGQLNSADQLNSAIALPPLLQDEQIFGPQGDRRLLLQSINHSLRYLRTSKASADYRPFAAIGITRMGMIRSLERFRQLVASARSATELQTAVEREFRLYQATGKNGQGAVAFTGYFEPVHRASRVQTPEFRYPIFRAPAGLAGWSKPHPTRAELEGADGLQFVQGRLKGLELVWLRDRLEAFLVQVQGSARLRLTDGTTMTIGYAGSTQYPYTGIGRELVKDGKLTLESLTLGRLTQYFQDHPADLDVYLPRNQRFIFFKDTDGAAATGSLGVPVTAERSIATDKRLFPPGALAMIATEIPYLRDGQLEKRRVNRFVLDQDTGSAIQGAGRVDVFMGAGPQAGDRAGLINDTGQLYYLLLKNP
jgi:membrane-bound lytic murein transglycosylase A